MNDNDSVEETTASPIDFSKYRTPELVTSITDFLSIGDKVIQVGRWAAIGCLVLALVVAAIFFPKLPLWVFFVVLFYVVPAGLGTGAMFGLAEAIRRSADGMLSIVDLALHETEIIASDVRKLRSGNQQLPPPGALVNQVYDHLIHPIVRDAFFADLGIIGRLLLWLYDRTLHRLIRFVIRRFVPDSYERIPTDEEIETTKELLSAAEKVADNEEAITSGLTAAREKIASVGFWLKLLIAAPLYLLFGVGFLLVVVFPLLVIYFTLAIEVEEAQAVGQCLEIVWSRL